MLKRCYWTRHKKKIISLSSLSHMSTLKLWISPLECSNPPPHQITVSIIALVSRLAGSSKISSESWYWWRNITWASIVWLVNRTLNRASPIKENLEKYTSANLGKNTFVLRTLSSQNDQIQIIKIEEKKLKVLLGLFFYSFFLYKKTQNKHRETLFWLKYAHF